MAPAKARFEACPERLDEMRWSLPRCHVLARLMLAGIGSGIVMYAACRSLLLRAPTPDLSGEGGPGAFESFDS